MGSYRGNVIDLEAFRRSREPAERSLRNDALLWDREPRGTESAQARRSAAAERGAWALDIGASLTVAVMAAAFVMRAMMF